MSPQIRSFCFDTMDEKKYDIFIFMNPVNLKTFLYTTFFEVCLVKSSFWSCRHFSKYSTKIFKSCSIQKNLQKDFLEAVYIVHWNWLLNWNEFKLIQGGFLSHLTGMHLVDDRTKSVPMHCQHAHYWKMFSRNKKLNAYLV